MGFPKLSTARSSFGGRGYYIPGQYDAAGGRRVFPSVTTALKQVAKPGLHQWIADQTAAFAVANLPYLMRVTEEAGWRFLRWYWGREPDLSATELRTHHEGVRDDAAELGTNVHEWVEAEADGISEQPELDTPEAQQMAEQFAILLQTHEITPLHSEFTVYDAEIGYAGTADADWMIVCNHENPCFGQERGVAIRVLIDVKTSRYTWPEHGFQVAALATAKRCMVEVTRNHPEAKLHEATVKGEKVKSYWIERENAEYDAIGLLHLRPRDLTPDGEEIPAFCSFVDQTPKRDIFMQGFKHALGMAEVMKKLK